MEPQLRFNEKSVIIHRDEDGFGLRVGGENPVFVDFVHVNGAAWKAGVRKGDRIIKVNGTLVRSYKHKRVVGMIQNCTPFVNLTLHPPETLAQESYTVVSSGTQSTEPTSGAPLLIGSNSNASNNLVANSMKTHSHQLRLHHPHSVSSNVNWLLDIGDDLFQDNQQLKPQQQQKHQQQQQQQQPPPQQQQQVNSDSILVTSNAHQSVGVSKLIVSGPSPLITSHSQLSTSGAKSKLRHNRNQSSTRDNPYYYYKSAPEKAQDATSCNSANSSLLSSQSTSSKSTTRLSIVRSRSSSKMSTRSTSGKYKSRNLGSRLVGDLRSLTITNSQATPSSLSTSPSSSELSDCDDQDSSRIDCSPLNASNPSTSGSSGVFGGYTSTNVNTSGSIPVDQSPKPKHTTRRLEIIRELVDTEKTHTERLKHLNDLLYKPIKAEGLVPVEQLKMVFSCHKTLFKIHRQIYKILSAAQQNTSECHQEPLVGRALVDIFEGELGKRLEKAASTFCACQATNTDQLNRFTRKDTKTGEFLAQVANQQMLGRLGIKDLLASCFQRLTKYPLLLENLLKATPTGNCGIHSKSLSEGSIATSLGSTIVSSATTDGLTNDNLNHGDQTTTPDKSTTAPTTSKTSDTIQTNANNNNIDDQASDVTSAIDDDYEYERLCISIALHQTRQIVARVNDAVKRATSHCKLRDIWKKTDKYPPPQNVEMPLIDIATQQMLHDGPLTLRLARRSFEVYVLLLTQYLIILTREGQDKYKFKWFTAEGKLFSPMFLIDEHLATRDLATDENGFYLLCKGGKDPKIYEFASQSPSERAKWKEKIHSAKLSNFASVPEDDNTLTRYRELISLDTLSSAPNNNEHSPTNNNIITISTQSNASLNEANYNNNNSSANTGGSVPLASSTTSSVQQINSNNMSPSDLDVRAQDV